MVEEAGWNLVFTGLVKSDSNIGFVSCPNGVTIDAIQLYGSAGLSGATTSGPQEPFSVDWVSCGSFCWVLGFSVRFYMRVSDSVTLGGLDATHTIFVSMRTSAPWGALGLDNAIYVGPYTTVCAIGAARYVTGFCDITFACPMLFAMAGDDRLRMRLGVRFGQIGVSSTHEYELSVIVRTAPDGWGTVQGIVPTTHVVVDSAPNPTQVVTVSNIPHVIVDSAPNPTQVVTVSNIPHVIVDSAPNPTQVVTIGNIPQVTIGNIPHVVVDSAPNPTQVVTIGNIPQVTIGNIPHVVVDSAPTPVQHVIVDNSPLPVKQSGDILVSLRQGGSS